VSKPSDLSPPPELVIETDEPPPVLGTASDSALGAVPAWAAPFGAMGDSKEITIEKEETAVAVATPPVAVATPPAAAAPLPAPEVAMSLAAETRERKRTPIPVEIVAQVLATPPRSAGVHEIEEETVDDEELEIVDSAVPLPAAALSDEVSAPRPTPPPLPVSAHASVPPLPAIVRPRVPTPIPLPAQGPEALAQRTRRRKHARPWFEEVFDEDYLRTLPFMTAKQTMREATFIEESLQVPKGGEVLDVACGYGRHAIELVQRGFKVTGLDLSLPLLIRAADETQRRALSVSFVHADMREMAFEGQFDGAYSMLTSFGYFDEETNLKVAQGIARALKPAGRFLLDAVNRDYIVSDLPTRVWWEGDGCVVLEEVDFNYHTSRVLIRRSVVFDDGRQLEQEISVRAYSLHEMGKLLRAAGFRVLEVSGALATRNRFFGATSRNLLILCEKRTEE